MDSIRVLDRDGYHRIHGGNIPHGSGALHKGHSVTAATSSIPSKYQTVVIKNNDKKGFQSKSKRFTYDSDIDVNPGPGSYLCTVSFENSSPSYSKKGTGGFASKGRRITKHEPGCSPGSGVYNLPSTLQSRRDYNKATATSSFHQPIANKIPDGTGKYAKPSPNQYNVSVNMTKKVNNVAADAAFKSKSLREISNTNDHAVKPAPWHYNVSDELVRDNVKVPVSSFKSKTERKMQQSPAPNPGPAAYHPGEAVEPTAKIILPRKHYLCISAPAMPMPVAPDHPGPGNYELVDYDGPEKHFMSSSAFVSSTSRWTGAPKNRKFPGPAHYRPVESNKQSFLYNAANKWVS